jgi:hypothetical protein
MEEEPIDTLDAPPLDPVNLDEPTPPEPQPNADESNPTEPPVEEEAPKGEPPAFNLDEYMSGIKVDEGQTYEFNQDLLKEIAPIANEEGVKPETLSRLANYLAQREAKGMEERQALQAKANEERAAYVATLDKQVAELRKADPQFASYVKAALNLDFIKGSVFEQLFHTTEIGHDPVVHQMLAWIGRPVAVDKGIGSHSTGRTNAPDMTLGQAWFGGKYK